MKPALSTVACPDWTFPRLFEHIERWGFVGCELRTFGYGSTQFACDPALTSASKLRAAFDKSGVAISALATQIRYDEKFGPPVIATVIRDTDVSIRETKSMVDLAVQLECPFVRVFAFELPEGEHRNSGLARVVDRLQKAADHCRNSGVKLMLENGGSFNTASDVAEILDRVNNPMLVTAYSAPVGRMAGEDIANAMNVLGDRCVTVKLKDLKNAKPVALGEGDLQCKETVESLIRVGFNGWITYEFDRAWLSTESWDIDQTLTHSARALFSWLGTAASPTLRRGTIARAAPSRA
jgi:sugar phosphate isomerase/epimerase